MGKLLVAYLKMLEAMRLKVLKVFLYEPAGKATILTSGSQLCKQAFFYVISPAANRFELHYGPAGGIDFLRGASTCLGDLLDGGREAAVLV